MTTIERLKLHARSAIAGAIEINKDSLIQIAAELEALQAKCNALERYKLSMDAACHAGTATDRQMLAHSMELLRDANEALQKSERDFQSKVFDLLRDKEALQKENAELNKALALKLDAMPSGLSAGQSMKLEKELASLRSNVAELQRDKCNLDLARYDLNQLRTTIAELQRDKERLDWLQETLTSIGYNIELDAWGVDSDAPYSSTIRSAIDAAMQEKPA